jgi:hypothetical protein
MELSDLIDMFRAIEDERLFELGFQLQHSSEGDLTIQEIGNRCGYGAFADFLEKVSQAKPPHYLDVSIACAWPAQRRRPRLGGQKEEQDEVPSKQD